VTDNLTGLMWTKDIEQIKGLMTWADALTACNNLVFAGHDDWLLPNVKELQSLFDYRGVNPALPSGHPFIINEQMMTLFASGSEVWFWSNTSAGWDLVHPFAFMVLMNSGRVEYYFKDWDDIFVWPVRGGK